MVTLAAVIAAWPAMADQSSQAVSVQVPIAAQNGSNQTGVATLTPTSDNKTRVDITITGEPDGASEPAHIHKGPCKSLDPKPTYPLTVVAAGKSTTVLDVPLSQLQTGSLAINLHESASALQNYVACGNIPAAAG
jgi:Cu/Zn superoxide dismutase